MQGLVTQTMEELRNPAGGDGRVTRNPLLSLGWRDFRGKQYSQWLEAGATGRSWNSSVGHHSRMRGEDPPFLPPSGLLPGMLSAGVICLWYRAEQRKGGPTQDWHRSGTGKG